MVTATQQPAKQQPAKLLYTTPEAAERLGVSPSTLIRLEEEGLISAVRFRRSVRFSEQALVEFIQRQEGVAAEVTAAAGCPSAKGGQS